MDPSIVYSDTNIYFRPFDDWTQIRIALEAESCLWFWDAVRKDRIRCVDSNLIQLEISLASKIKRSQADAFIQLVAETIPFSTEVEELANEIVERLRLPAYDALHVSFAARGKADILLTCDDDLLKKAARIEEYVSGRAFPIAIFNPVQFIRHYLE